MQRKNRLQFLFLIVVSLCMFMLGAAPTINQAQAQTAPTLKVQYKVGLGNANDIEVSPQFKIVNTGTTSVPMSELTLRYYFTKDGNAGVGFRCNFAVVGCNNVVGTFVPASPVVVGADTYLDITFNAAANSIAPGGNSGDIQTMSTKFDFTNFNEANDYSYDGTKTAYADWSNVTLYRNGTLVWGTPPAPIVPTNTPINAMPDLIISGLQAINLDACKPTKVPLRVTVSNIGAANAGLSYIKLSEDNTSNSFNLAVNGITAGQSIPIEVFFDPTTTRNFTAIADGTSVVAESNETNNTRTLSVPPLGMPCVPSPTPTHPSGDITLSGEVVESGSQRPLIGTVSLKSCVASLGSISANSDKNGKFSLFVPSRYIDTCTDVMVTISSFGFITIDRVEDVIFLYKDSVRSYALNYNGDYTVVPLPDLAVTNITNAPPTIPCGTGWNPGTNVTVANQGTNAAAAFTVTLNGSAQTVNSLAVGQSVTLRYSFNGGTFTAIADPNNDITEGSERNNTMTKTLPVSDPLPCPTPTRTGTGPATRLPTRTFTPGPTRTGTGPVTRLPTRTFTPTPTPTRSNTPVTLVPTNTLSTTSTPPVSVQIKGNGTDNNQQTGFAYVIKNSISSPVSGISVRVYFTLDGSNAASNYVLEKYYDQSGVATISGPTLATGSTYYFTVNYGTASLPVGGQWELQTALHLANWGTTFSSGNDWFHTGFAVGALPTAYTNTNYIPAYRNGTLVWGFQP